MVAGQIGPFDLETCHLASTESSGLLGAPLGRASLFSVLEHKYGLEIAHAEEEVDATSADPHSPRLLRVPQGSALLRIRQEILSTQARLPFTCRDFTDQTVTQF